MSQNIFTTTSCAGPVRVRAGWDSPLQELFCNVQLLVEGREEDVDLPECFLRTAYDSVQQMVQCLAEAGICLPPGMKQAVQHDVEIGAGNVLRDFDVEPPSRIS